MENQTTQTPLSGPSLHPSPGGGAPSVFLYKDYRQFLRDWFEHKKSDMNGYSGALFAKKAGLSSHTLLGMVIRGSRNLSYSSIRAFAKALGFKAKERLYFEKLVLFNQAKTSEDKAEFFEQLLTITKGLENQELVKIKNYKDFYAHWYTVAIRELVNLPDFKADPEWISARLKRKVSKKQASEAWDTLLKIGLVRKNSKLNKYEVVDAAVDFDPGEANFVIRNFHKEYLERSQNSIDEESIEERELSSLTIAVDDASLEEIKQKIREFRKYLNLIYSEKNTKNNKPKHLIALNHQLIILTDSLGGNNEPANDN